MSGFDVSSLQQRIRYALILFPMDETHRPQHMPVSPWEAHLAENCKKLRIGVSSQYYYNYNQVYGALEWQPRLRRVLPAEALAAEPAAVATPFLQFLTRALRSVESLQVECSNDFIRTFVRSWAISEWAAPRLRKLKVDGVAVRPEHALILLANAT